ncbi:ABC transporter substrate-binding protein [Roseomonas sp. KE2513]|uniref:ABC transporter substrate-binding protein n=1 Tax=Roseomonas sp. KE2513 TaxID=2479202 RepID=UPI0018E03A86|nr:ABC transporter substrate-binding protein [Roseomonas sp. KE2513]
MRNPGPGRASRRALLAAVLLLPAAPVLAQAGASGVVETLHAALIGVMRDARRLGVRGRLDRLRPVMQLAFDLPAMTRIAVGPAWSGIAPDQQAALVAAFSDWTIATYANRFDGYSGESFATTGESTLANGDHLVRTVLNRVNNAPVQLNYLLRQGQGAWRIVDIYLTGTISELASRRAEFATLLREGGAERLTAELRRRATDLLRA